MALTWGFRHWRQRKKFDSLNLCILKRCFLLQLRVFSINFDSTYKIQMRYDLLALCTLSDEYQNCRICARNYIDEFKKNICASIKKILFVLKEGGYSTITLCLILNQPFLLFYHFDVIAWVILYCSSLLRGCNQNSLEEKLISKR